MAFTLPAEGCRPALAALQSPMVCAQDSGGLPSRLLFSLRSQQTTLDMQVLSSGLALLTCVCGSLLYCHKLIWPSCSSSCRGRGNSQCAVCVSRSAAV